MYIYQSFPDRSLPWPFGCSALAEALSQGKYLCRLHPTPRRPNNFLRCCWAARALPVAPSLAPSSTACFPQRTGRSPGSAPRQLGRGWWWWLAVDPWVWERGSIGGELGSVLGSACLYTLLGKDTRSCLTILPCLLSTGSFLRAISLSHTPEKERRHLRLRKGHPPAAHSRHVCSCTQEEHQHVTVIFTWAEEKSKKHQIFDHHEVCVDCSLGNIWRRTFELQEDRVTSYSQETVSSLNRLRLLDGWYKKPPKETFWWRKAITHLNSKKIGFSSWCEGMLQKFSSPSNCRVGQSIWVQPLWPVCQLNPCYHREVCYSERIWVCALWPAPWLIFLCPGA